MVPNSGIVRNQRAKCRSSSSEMLNNYTATPQRRPWKWIIALASIGILLMLVAIVVVLSFFWLPSLQSANRASADARLKLLEHEFTQIEPLPSAVRLAYESSHKTSLGGVSAEYETDKTYKEIRAHYDKELKRLGWTFAAEKPVTIWWRDYGGKEAFYCKDHNTAMLEYG